MHGKDTCDHTEYYTHDGSALHALIGSLDIPEDENKVHVVISISLCNIRLRCGVAIFPIQRLNHILYIRVHRVSSNRQNKHVWCLIVV